MKKTFVIASFSAPFIADAASYVVSIASLLLVKTELRASQARPATGLHIEIAEGLRWLWRKPLIRYMAFLTGGLNMVSAATPLIVIVLAKHLGASDVDIGLVFSIGGIGGVLGSLVGGRIQKRFSFGQVIVWSIWINALLFPLYAAAPNFGLLGLIAASIAMLSPVYNVVQFSYRLALIPDTLQGRVNSTFRLVAFGLNPLGAALSGLLLERVGAMPTVAFFALWYFALAVLTSLNTHVRSARPLDQVAAA